MQFVGRFNFVGVEKRQGFKDPSQVFYIAGFVQGMDTLRCYINAEDYGRYSSIPRFSEVEVTVDYNPVNNRINLLSVEEGGVK